MKRGRTTAAVLAISLFAAAPAQADNYDVLGFGDTPSPVGCQSLGPGSFQCPTFRDAVAAANQDQNADSITLHSGTYVLSEGQLALNQGLIIFGEGARSTIVQAGPATRVFAVNSTVQIANITIQGGTFAGGNGGNILVGTTANLALLLTRVTGGNAAGGGGIANNGTLTIQNSLIDHNQASNVGGGILNAGGIDLAPELLVLDSTIARNTAAEGGGGIMSNGNAQNTVQLGTTTVGRNTGGGVALTPAQEATANGSIIASNLGGNCGGSPLASGQLNVESGTDCGLSPANGNLQGVDPGLAAELSNEGGPTDVLTIPASSPAVDLVNPCFSGIDQRGFQRFTAAGQPCDAGAYEQSATGPVQPPSSTPTPTPPPVPTATLTPEPTPVANRSVAAEPVKGKVLVKKPGSNTFVELREGVITNGTEVDTRKGTVKITTSAGEVAEFRDGIFKVVQSGRITTLTLSEKLTGCPKKSGRASAAAKKPKTRKLWGDGKGKFRTKGQYGAATVRGTEWLVQDTCTTTFFRVKVGAVTVRDDVRKKSLVLRKGKTYTARARK